MKAHFEGVLGFLPRRPSHEMGRDAAGPREPGSWDLLVGSLPLPLPVFLGVVLFHGAGNVAVGVF